MPEAQDVNVDRSSLIKYYSDVARDAKFDEAVQEWGYDQEFLRQCGFDDAGTLFSQSCGGGCPLRMEGQLPKKGSTIVDLGCGAGHDVILAARVVGATGHVIGVDITPAMLERTQTNVNRHRREGDAPVRLVQGVVDDAKTLAHLEDGIADMVISNGALNLCADKKVAFALAYRLLKPGGRFHLSDVCEDAAAVADVEAGGPGGTPAPCSARPEQESSCGGSEKKEGETCGGGTCGGEKPAPEEYVKLMGEVGFDGARCVAIGSFWTSRTTRTMDFVGVKGMSSPSTTAVVRKTSRGGLKPQYLVAAGFALVLAFTVARAWGKRS